MVYYHDQACNIYAEEINDVIQFWVYGTATEMVQLQNPMAHYFNRCEAEASDDPTYQERLLAANAEMDGRFMEIRWDQDDYEVETHAVLLPGPDADQIENAEVYGDVVRGELSQAYLEASELYRSQLVNLDPDDTMHVQVEVIHMKGP